MSLSLVSRVISGRRQEPRIMHLRDYRRNEDEGWPPKSQQRDCVPSKGPEHRGSLPSTDEVQPSGSRWRSQARLILPSAWVQKQRNPTGALLSGKAHSGAPTDQRQATTLRDEDHQPQTTVNRALADQWQAKSGACREGMKSARRTV